MAASQHETIANRLSQILIKLNQGDHLAPAELAEEFGTHIRTIQRDLKVRMAYLPLIKTRGRYHLEPSYLGKLNFKDIERFAKIVGVKGLFPSMSSDFLKELLGVQNELPWRVQGHYYEDLSTNQGLFDRIKDAIKNYRSLKIGLLKNGEIKEYHDVRPYKLINTKGIWYLAGIHEAKLKTFGVGRIKYIDFNEWTFEPDPKIKNKVEAQEGIWDGEQEQRVTLLINNIAAEYFRRRQLIPYQKIIHEHASGSILIETTIGHPNQILPIVRYWMPNITIQSPIYLQKLLKENIQEYLGIICADKQNSQNQEGVEINE